MFEPISVQSIQDNLRRCSRNRYSVLNSRRKREVTRCVDVFPRERYRQGKFMVSYMASGDNTGKVAYRKFLSDGFEDTHYFYYTEFVCPPEEAEKIKEQFPDFVFLLYCGRGQFGGVWLVEDLSGQIVALKLIPKKDSAHLKAEKEGLIAYRNKIRNFEHLVQIYHVGQTEDFFYYTMEAAYSVSDRYYIPITLARLFEHCSFSPLDSADISLDILEGLETLHSHDLAHRDIKPENIAVVDNKIKICDIGLVMDKTRKSTAGTEFFLPEDIGEIPGERFGTDCDLFAAGKVLYSMLCNDGDVARFPQIDREILRDRLAQKLNLILNKACAPSFRDRYACAHEFMRDLVNVKPGFRKDLGFF